MIRLWPRRRRRRERLAPLDEGRAYRHSYGDRSTDVRIVDVEPEPRPPRRPRIALRVTGEDLRRRFEELLDSRGKQDRGRRKEG